jgi:hypothetical protein
LRTFRHLKAEEFISLIEGAVLPEDRRRHLNECERCNTAWKSVESSHSDFASMSVEIPEPDWDDFRESVRSELLSRSVQRASAVRRWTGWPIRPAMAWGLSIVFVVGITAGGLLWHREASEPAATAGAEEPLDTGAPLIMTLEAELSVWSQTGVFEELSQLESDEEEYFREILQSAEQESPLLK